MELLAGIETRRSWRAFKPTPVSKGLIEQIMKAAGRSPSYTNTQPWEVAVVSGEQRDKLSKIIFDLANADTAPNPDLPSPAAWPPVLEQRFREHSANRFKALGIDRANEPQRKEMRLRNFNFYGAPCALFLFIDRSLGSWSIFDMGLFAQTILLAAHALGLGTCLQASTAGYPDAVRDFLGIPKTKLLVLCIALGYPEPDAKMNTYHSLRVGADTFVKWYG